MYSTQEEMSYGVAAKCHVDVSEDGLLAIDARASAEVTGRAFGSAVARMSGGGVVSGTRGPGGGRKVGGGGRASGGGGSGSDVAAGAKQFASAVQLTGRVELTQIILGFNVRAWRLLRAALCTSWRAPSPPGAHFSRCFACAGAARSQALPGL